MRRPAHTLQHGALQVQQDWQLIASLVLCQQSMEK
jgi:hypothetical protein